MIEDDDDPEVSVSFGATTYELSEESSSMPVEVILSADPERTLVVSITVTGGDASSLMGIPESLTFMAGGDVVQSFTITALDDTNLINERVELTLSVPAEDTRADVGDPETTTLSVMDNDIPSVNVSFESDTYTVLEGSTAEVTVVLSAAPERLVMIQIAASEQDGAESADYSLPSAFVTFGADATSATFTLTTEDDNVDDDGESVLLRFVDPLPAGMSRLAPSETVVSITDNDDPLVSVSFDSSSYVVSEGGEVTIPVTLDSDPERILTISIEASGEGGAASSDYSLSPVSLVFSPGVTSRNVIVTATDDDVDDDDENVRLSFGPLPAMVNNGANEFAIVSITDNDDPLVSVSFGSSGYVVSEGGEVTIPVTLDSDPERTFVIAIEASGEGGAASSDYSLSPASLEFSPGVTSRNVTVTVPDNNIDDDGKSVLLSFVGPLPLRVIEGSNRTAAVSISDDDVPEVSVSFDSNVYRVPEGEAITVMVTLTVAPERTVTISLDVVRNAGASTSDYSLSARSLTFSPEERLQSITLSAEQDTLNDDGENLLLSFVRPLPAMVNDGANVDAVVSIVDDDAPSTGGRPGSGTPDDDTVGRESIEVQFGSTSYSVLEGSFVSVTVRLTRTPGTTINIPIRVVGGTASEDDYYLSDIPDELQFNSNQTIRSFTVRARSDIVIDDGETIELSLGAPQGVDRCILPCGTTLTILEPADDDDTVSVRRGLLPPTGGVSLSTLWLVSLFAGGVVLLLVSAGMLRLSFRRNHDK